MARGKCNFRQRDLTAAMKAARAAGVAVARFEVGADGKIIVVIVGAETTETDPEQSASNEKIVL
jgi:hypothetical protein